MNLFHILLVEDNEGDIIFIKEGLEVAKIPVNLSVVNDGKEAIDFLDKKVKYEMVELPDLILLDINLPKKNGHEVLKYIKGNESLKHIPVTIFTTSSMEGDISACYNNHANCYITKPHKLADFLRVVATTVNFWFHIVKLPAKNK